ncbi:MAG: amino acid ABC transporter permease [Ruminococcaceae bacterium]|nr:amino acid ABC transporter permease [Oscillospiraceae bacterium]
MDFLDQWSAFWRLFYTNGGYKRVLSEGLANTLKISILGLIIGIVIGTLIAAVKVMPKYKRLPRVLNVFCNIYVGFFRGTPIVVQLLLAYYVLFPLMGVSIGSLNTCILIFGLNSGAYVSEIMRAGIQSVDAGQMEAGRALGLGYAPAMIKIVIPQAIKNILPTLGNEFIALIKDTSVVSFVAAVDLYKVFTEMGNVNYEYLAPYLMMAIIYIVLILLVTLLFKLIEQKMHRGDRV